jgi:hypothetical protein
MAWKEFIKINKWKIIIFIILFVLIYLVPYFKAEVDPSTVSIMQSGRYPLIWTFLILLIFLPDILSGDIIWYEFFGFIIFILSFFVVYLISCFIYWIIKKYKK